MREVDWDKREIDVDENIGRRNSLSSRLNRTWGAERAAVGMRLSMETVANGE